MGPRLNSWRENSLQLRRRYWCCACRRWHEGEPAGIVGHLLEYCPVAIHFYESLNIITPDGGDEKPPRRFRLVKGAGLEPARPSRQQVDTAVLGLLRERFGDAIASVRTYRNPNMAYVRFRVNGIECRSSCRVSEDASTETIADALARSLRLLVRR